MKDIVSKNSTPQFLLSFLKNPVSVGAIVPSSSSLARMMLHGLEIKPGDKILELGPGTGAFTRHIRQVIPDTSNYLGIEREARFVELLEERFPKLQFINGNATNLPQLCADAGKCNANIIISGLPFAILMPQVRDKIIRCLDQMMSEGSIFRTFQYVHTYPLPSSVRFRRNMETYFGKHDRSKVIYKNLPPAFVLTWYR